MRAVDASGRGRPDETGASAVEYTLLLVGLAGLLVGVWFGFGSMVSTTFFRATSCISAQAQSVC